MDSKQTDRTVPSMRAKMRISEIERTDGCEILTFNAVGISGGYPEDGSDENNTFARWSPCAELKITIANPNLFGKYSVGDVFYLDFTPTQ